MTTKKFQKELPEIKVIEKFSPDVIEFETKEELIEYLQKNKEELSKITTHKLNKLYKTKGYKITKIKGELGLRKVHVEEQPAEEHKSDSTEEKSEEETTSTTPAKAPKLTLKELAMQVELLRRSFNTLINHLALVGIFDEPDQDDGNEKSSNTIEEPIIGK